MNRAVNLHETRVPPEVLEIIADVLLASAGRDDVHPAYDEKQIIRKQRRVSRSEEYFLQSSAAGRSIDGDMAADLLLNSELSEKERCAWRMHYEGYLTSEIARCMGISWSAASKLVRSASKRMQKNEPCLNAVSAVYHDEVRKRVYRKPEHCDQQPCRKLGYCRYAIHGQ